MLCNAKICEELFFKGVNFIGRYVVRHGRLLFLPRLLHSGAQTATLSLSATESHSSCDKEKTKIKVLQTIELNR